MKNVRLVKYSLMIFMYIMLLVFQIWNMFGKGGIYNFSLNTVEAKRMLVELLIALILFFTINYCIKDKKKLIIGSLVLLVFAYLHQTIIPLVHAVAYFGVVLFSGALLMALFCRKKDIRKSTWWIGSLVLGICWVCICVAMLSVFTIYSVMNTWLLLLITGTLGLFFCIKRKMFDANEISQKLLNPLFLSFIEMSILVQIGRVGLQSDYDALWYGLRSRYVLANSIHGIYEDLSLVGFTYLYPKGFEILLLPLTQFNSWNSQFLFNEILLLVLGVVSWLLAKEVTNKDIAYLISATVITLPGLLSMAMTVKPDIVTCLFQMITILMVYLFYKENSNTYIMIGVVAIISSYCFKITSLLFSTVTILGLLPFVNIKKLKLGVKEVGGMVVGMATLLVVWGRTFVLTGAPLIAFIGIIYDKLGLDTKWPYAIVGGINQETESGINLVEKLLKGIWGYFVLPTGESFSHVIISWGTSLPILLSFLSLFILGIKRRKAPDQLKWLWLIGVFHASLMFGITFLSQNDGNYFLLFYTVNIVILGSFCLKNYKVLAGIFRIAICFNLFFTSFSNWSWSNGFTDLKIVNKGYVERQELYEQKYVEKYGNKILSIVNSEASNKMLAVTADVEQLICFQCVTERWLDIATSNPLLLKDADSLYKYLNECRFSYIYIDDSASLLGGQEEYLLLELIKQGRIEDIIYDEHAALLVVSDFQMEERYLDQMARDFYLRRGKIIREKEWYEDGWVGKNVEFYGYSESGKLSLDIWVPYEIEEKFVTELWVNNVKLSDIQIDKSNISYTIEIPPGEYAKIQICNSQFIKSQGDERELCYILNINCPE